MLLGGPFILSENMAADHLTSLNEPQMCPYFGSWENWRAECHFPRPLDRLSTLTENWINFPQFVALHKVEWGEHLCPLLKYLRPLFIPQSATNSGQKLNGLCKYEDHIQQVFIIYCFILPSLWRRISERNAINPTRRRVVSIPTVKNWLSDRIGIDILASSFLRVVQWHIIVLSKRHKTAG